MRGADRISNLPTEIIELVLICLPVREAVRTSALSKAWRYRWTSIPRLVFDQDCCPDSWHCQDEVLGREILHGIINHVLSLHTGSIQVLKLADLHSVRDTYCWILDASRSLVKELVLVNLEQYDELPSSLYACNSLVRLELRSCILKLPSAFKGFKNLKTLDLRFVQTTDGELESLVSGCASLEKLTLTMPEGVDHVKINAPNLQCLVLSCFLSDITFGETHSKLSDICIHLINRKRPDCHVDEKSFLAQFFIKLPSIKRLVLGTFTLQYLSMGCGSIPERLATPCFGLRHLSIHINLSRVEEMLAALCIFRSSPNLTELEIENKSYNCSVGLSHLDGIHSCCALSKLRTLKLHGQSKFRESQEFIELLLMNSPALEKMYVTGCPRDQRGFISKGSTSSTQLELILEKKLGSAGEEIEM